jgi:hypothetical protein
LTLDECKVRYSNIANMIRYQKCHIIHDYLQNLVRHLILILREEGDPMTNYPTNLGLPKMKMIRKPNGTSGGGGRGGGRKTSVGITRKAKVTGQQPVIVSYNGQKRI